MSYEPTRLVKIAWSHPPRCLAGFEVEPLKEPPHVTRVLDEQAFFHLRCPCGSASLHILGYPNDLVAGYLLCPISAQCLKCDRVIPLFDAKEHGYDGEYAHTCYSGRGTGEPRQFECPQCSTVTFEAYPTFSYQTHEDDITPQAWTHIQDFFDWFILRVRREQCGILSDAVDYECA
jgi:hypothetical protein